MKVVGDNETKPPVFQSVVYRVSEAICTEEADLALWQRHDHPTETLPNRHPSRSDHGASEGRRS